MRQNDSRRLAVFILDRVFRSDSYADILLDVYFGKSSFSPIAAISVRWSHPEWLVKRWIEQWGVDRTRSLCQANNQRPKMSIRINRLKTNREEMLNNLRHSGFHAESSPLLDEFIMVDQGGELVTYSAFSEGLYSIQDVSARQVGRLMDPHPGERIVDLTAVPGGKTTHMSELENDQVIVVAGDRYLTRLQKVRKNQIRLNLKGISPVLCDGCHVEVKKVDKVLVDAPCSELGVIRRRDEIRWRFIPEKLSSPVFLQKSLLWVGANFINPGGVLVYSTCTILLEENEQVVDDFLNNHRHFKIEDARQFVDSSAVTERDFVETWTDFHRIDGSFAVRFKKVA